MKTLHDAVSLRHFATVGRLEVLQARHGHHDEPRWTEEVHAEIDRASAAGVTHCAAVLGAAWLGPPAQPSVADLKMIVALQIGLNDGVRPATQHRGEAESIHFAEQSGGQLLTDVQGAYKFARRRPSLGPGRVIDSIDVLRAAVAAGDLSAAAAAKIADDIESAGRHLRPPHRVARSAAYYQ